MVVLRDKLQSFSDPGQARLKPKTRKKKNMASRDFYEDLARPRAQVTEPSAQPGLADQPVTGDYIAANLNKISNEKILQLNPGARARDVEANQDPAQLQSFYNRLQTIHSQAVQQRMAAQARSAYERMERMQDILSQQAPQYSPVNYQPVPGRPAENYSFSGGGPVVNQVRNVANQYGWGSGAQWNALANLIQRESSWNPGAANPTSSARGLFQKMTSMHGPVEPTIAGQTNWGLNYIKGKYGSPLAAWRHWLSRVPINGKDVGHWY